MCRLQQRLIVTVRFLDTGALSMLTLESGSSRRPDSSLAEA
ncbi:hypothetical protein C4K40_2216 [Pseudomonas sp. CMR5c]|nr:hypothetical protein C4K40_2216 [Pseudomonas sp. CMR5c]